MNDEPPDADTPTQPVARRALEMALDTPAGPHAPEWEPPTAAELSAAFEGYTVESLIGRGGMGAVYKAVQNSLKRHVAIKLLPAELAQADAGFAARFQAEAETMATLDHANIVTIHDFGRTAAGHFFIVMEHVEGTDLHQLIRHGRLELAQALSVVSQVCGALEFAHGKGFIHRDIKPANILVKADGTVKVGDFGIAKMMSGTPGGTAPETMATGTMGTPFYSAPEQMNGGKVDHRADIYSLGVMLYEMLTGQLPAGHFQPPSKKVPLDERVDGVVLRAMADDPDARYPTATAVRTDVEKIRTPSASSGARLERVFWGVLAAAAVVFVVWFWHGTVIRVEMPATPPVANADANPRLDLTASEKEELAPPSTPPARPSVPCRLVVLDVASQSREARALPFATQTEGSPDDLVQVVAAPRAETVFWLRKDGQIGGATSSADDEKILRTSESWGSGFVKLEVPEGSLVALHESGEVRVAGALEPWVKERLTSVVDISYYRTTLVTLKKDGTAAWMGDKESFGPMRAQMEQRLKQLGNRVARISQHRAILRDGSVSDWGLGKPIAVPGHAREFATSHGCVRLESGHWAFIGRPGAGLDRWVASVKALDIVDGGMLDASRPCALRTSASEWKLWPRLDPRAAPLEPLGRALQGAHQIALRPGPVPLVFALLPAAKVPRSGCWKADELLKARTPASH
jgi:serine/threonine protein kinase